MNLKTLLVLILVSNVGISFAQKNPAYKIFNEKGKEVKWNRIIRDAANVDVVFFGEQHNDPIGHWLELRLLKQISDATEKKVIAGAEMFESDNQLIVNEYLEGRFDDSKFEEDARLWKNYFVDYKPLLKFARNTNIKFIATNVPRRYASMVYRGGFEVLDSLSDEAKSYIAPLPVNFDPELGSYKNMMGMSMGHGAGAGVNLAKAQAIKDATMAWFISENMEPKTVFIHFNGSWHSENKEGIVWHLEKYRPGTKVLTITSVWQDNISKLSDENKGKADYIVVVPEDMTKGY